MIRGKRFHRRVQKDWEDTAEGAVTSEHTIELFRRLHSGRRVRAGRVDMFIDDLGDFVTVVEIKGTDWNRIQPKNRRRLMASHRRQIWRYIEKFVDGENISVCPGIIYPREPVTPGVRAEVEEYLNEYGLQVVWYEDQS